MSKAQDAIAVILAAGEGKRMQSDRAKVLHQVLGRPLLEHVLLAAEQAGIARAVVVVGARKEQVTEFLAERASKMDVRPAIQAEQRGTGHALSCALPVVEALGGAKDLVVLCGDAPLIRARTIEQLLELHRARDAGATILTADLDDPTGYGRIVRAPSGDVERIVEHRDASEAELLLREINSADYVFDRAAVAEALGRVTDDNRQGEFYLTDTIALLKASGRTILALKVPDPGEVLGVNTGDQLEDAARAFLLRGTEA